MSLISASIILNIKHCHISLPLRSAFKEQQPLIIWLNKNERREKHFIVILPLSDFNHHIINLMKMYLYRKRDK